MNLVAKMSDKALVMPKDEAVKYLIGIISTLLPDGPEFGVYNKMPPLAYRLLRLLAYYTGKPVSFRAIRRFLAFEGDVHTHVSALRWYLDEHKMPVTVKNNFNKGFTLTITDPTFRFPWSA